MLKRSKLKVESIKFRSESLMNNILGDPYEREAIVIENHVKENTPVLIGLSGFFGSSLTFLNERYAGVDFMDVLSSLSDRGVPFIIVLPDTMTSYYGNQFVNSEAVGNYEDFIAKDLVSVIREKYGERNIGIFGKSSGGFGAYTIASRHHEIFRGFIDVSGDSGFEYCYLRDFPYAVLELSRRSVRSFVKHFSTLTKPTNSEMSAMSIVAASAFYSPKKGGRGSIDLPFSRKDHMLREDVWKKWLSFDPVRNVHTYADNLRDMKVILQVGNRDEFFINIGMRALSASLKENKIKHEYMEYDDGHFNIEYFYLRSIPSLIRALS
ncbi:MAG: alpha/beta hydrolase-fold protein [Thermoplasmatales archaeon]